MTSSECFFCSSAAVQTQLSPINNKNQKLYSSLILQLLKPKIVCLPEVANGNYPNSNMERSLIDMNQKLQLFAYCSSCILKLNKVQTLVKMLDSLEKQIEQIRVNMIHQIQSKYKKLQAHSASNNITLRKITRRKIQPDIILDNNGVGNEVEQMFRKKLLKACNMLLESEREQFINELPSGRKGIAQPSVNTSDKDPKLAYVKLTRLEDIKVEINRVSATSSTVDNPISSECDEEEDYYLADDFVSESSYSAFNDEKHPQVNQTIDESSTESSSRADINVEEDIKEIQVIEASESLDDQRPNDNPLLEKQDECSANARSVESQSVAKTQPTTINDSPGPPRLIGTVARAATIQSLPENCKVIYVIRRDNLLVSTNATQSHPPPPVEALVESEADTDNSLTEIGPAINSPKKVRPLKSKKAVKNGPAPSPSLYLRRYKARFMTSKTTGPFFCLNKSCDRSAVEYPDKECLAAHVKEAHLLEDVDKEMESDGFVLNDKPKHFVCNYCGADCKDIYQFDKHKFKAHGIKSQHSCPYCDLVMNTKVRMQYHIKKAHVDPLICRYCNKEFKHRGNLTKHVNTTHLNLKPFMCEICSKSFTTKNQLKNHCGRHHPESFDLPTYKCIECDIVYTGKHSLITHQKLVHLNETRFKCEQCGKGFANRLNLENHAVVHTKEKNYECSVCKEKFAYKHYLKVHSYKHGGEKPYKCNVCGKRFLFPFKLKQHEGSVHNIGNHRYKKQYRKPKKTRPELEFILP